ncbi:hypothetical protein O6H91_05G122000 [Diphasiastrum complanatum]|uniref:Uncharacterized protein n=1 Tax=Diphasiastrum complanatum TaxID=34168 RepID=A0ACC2DSQ5_DIPCM|nr:hypothetical protein O6H91_05G122000 [Diphasiastrum complanatum]
MEAAASFFENRSTSWSYDSLKNFKKLSPYVQQHLRKVYMTVGGALLVSAVGVYVHMLLGIGGLLTGLGFIGASVWLASIPSSAAEEGKRLKLLGAAAFCQGASLGTLIEAVLNFDPSIVVTALLGSFVVFACFSGAALLARRREFLFLGGLLTSAVSTMMMLQFSSMLFGGASLMYMIEIYGGLLLFVGYVLFDTQIIIEKADRGDRDYVKHSLDLFVDFAGIFVRILLILTRNARGRERKEERRRARSTRY